MKLRIPKKKAVKLSLREKKHQANLRKNNGLYFQIGLIVALFLSYGVFQLQFEKNKVVVHTITVSDEAEKTLLPVDYIVEEHLPKKEVPQTPKKNNPVSANPTVVDNHDPVIETVIDTPPTVVDKAPGVDEIKVTEAEPEIDTFHVSLVSELPVFPGCEKLTTKAEQFECFTKKVAKVINRKFNTDVASDNGITGRQKISVTFIVNTKGEIVNVKARAPHPELEKEAIKAVKMLPNMKPAKQGYKTVNVSYALPIIFEVH